MPIYKETVTADTRDGTEKGMTSWMRNCVNFINASTGLEIKFRTVSSLYGSAGFHVDVPAGDAFIRFGVMMSTVFASSNYLSGIILADGFYPLNGYGNYFDCSSFFSCGVTVIFGGGLLHVLVSLPYSENRTLFLANTATEISTGKKFAGCLGVVVKNGGTADISGIMRNGLTHNGTRVYIKNAETRDGRYRLENLFAFGESENPLPELEPFDVLFDSGEIKNAIIPGENRVSDPRGKTVCRGKFISFI